MSLHASSFMEAGVSYQVLRQCMARSSYPLPWGNFDREAVAVVTDHEDIGKRCVEITNIRMVERLNGEES